MIVEAEITPISTEEAEWRTLRLSDGLISNLQTGFACGKHNQTGDGIAHIRPFNVSTEGQMDFTKIKSIPTSESDRDERILKQGDVVFNNTNSPELVGKTALYLDNVPRAFSNHMTRLRVNGDIIRPKFLAIALHQLWREGYFADKCNNHVSQASISRAVLLDTEISVPPLEVQDSLLSLIDRLDSRTLVARDRLATIPALLKKFRQSVLAAACSGQLTADWRNISHNRTLVVGENPEKSISRLSKAMEDAEPIESLPELGELPESWTWAPVSALSKVIRGASPRPAGDPKLFGGSIPWITVAPITADKSPYLRATPTGLTDLGKKASRVVNAGTFLLTNSGATLGVPKITEIEGCINDGVVALLDPAFDKLYGYYYLSSMTMTLREINQGMGQPNLNTDLVRRIPFPLPPLEEQAEIVRRVESLFALADSIESRLADATAQVERTTQAILAKAFRGEF